MSAAEREAANEKDSEEKCASRESMIYLTACPDIIVHCHNVSCTGKGLSDDVADATSHTYTHLLRIVHKFIQTVFPGALKRKLVTPLVTKQKAKSKGERKKARCHTQI